jgi:hypothetical protein
MTLAFVLSVIALQVTPDAPAWVGEAWEGEAQMTESAWKGEA